MLLLVDDDDNDDIIFAFLVDSYEMIGKACQTFNKAPPLIKEVDLLQYTPVHTSLSQFCLKTCLANYKSFGFACEYIPNADNSNGKCIVYLGPLKNEGIIGKPGQFCWILGRNKNSAGELLF